MYKKVIVFLLAMVLLMPFGTALGVTYYRVNTSWLKAHESPSYSARVVDSYRRDFAATICRVGRDGWVKVRFRPGGNMVFVQKKYLAKCSSYTAYISKDNTVLHAGPAISFKSLGKLSTGTKVTVLTHGHAFDYVSTPRGTGYVRNTHLTKNKPAAKPFPKTAVVQNPTGKNVVMRKGPGTKYKAIGTYRVGTKMNLLSYGKTWCKVSHNGRTGYMMTRYLKR